MLLEALRLIGMTTHEDDKRGLTSFTRNMFLKNPDNENLYMAPVVKAMAHLADNFYLKMAEAIRGNLSLRSEVLKRIPPPTPDVIGFQGGFGKFMNEVGKTGAGYGWAMSGRACAVWADAADDHPVPDDAELPGDPFWYLECVELRIGEIGDVAAFHAVHVMVGGNFRIEAART